MIEGKLEETVAAVKIQFVANAEAVVFNRFDANSKLVGDLLAGAVFGYELKDATFSCGEILDLRFAEQQLLNAGGAALADKGHGRTDESFPEDDFVETFEQIIDRVFL